MSPDQESSVRTAPILEAFRTLLWQFVYPCTMLVVYWMLHNIAGLNEKQLDWGFYAAFCASLPITCLLLRYSFTTRFGIAFGCIAIPGAILWLALHGVFHKGNTIALLAAFFLGGFCTLRTFRRKYPFSLSIALTILYALLAFVLLHISSKLAWWTDLSYLRRHNWLLIPVYLATSVLFWRYVSPDPAIPPATMRRLRDFAYWLVVIVIFLESFRTFGLFQVDTGCMHHWTCYVGPVELVRQGGVLLWDVPSQYGFLNVLLAAILPVSSAWQAVYILAGSAQFVVGWMLFHHFCDNRSWKNITSAAILSIVGVFVIPGWMLTGSLLFPSVSALRFIWVVLMIVFLFKLATVQDCKRKLHLHALNAIWLIGVIWSFESAFYCSVTLGSYLVADYCVRVQTNLKYASELKLFLEPALMLLMTTFVIWLVYHLNFGHGPDWRGYFEHALAFQAGFGAMPIVLTGGLLYILAVVAFQTRVCRLNSFSPVGRAVFSMACAAVAVFSYFAGRSHENNILNIFPVPFAGLVFAARLIKDRDTVVLRIISVSLMSPVVFLGVGNSEFFVHLRNTFLHQSHSVDSLVPSLPAPLTQLLQKLPPNKSASIVLADFQGFSLPSKSLPINLKEPATSELWLPLRPLAVLVPLSPERIAIYFSRWRQKRTSSGWLIYGPAEKPYIDSIIRSLAQSFRLEEEVHSGEYIALYYTPSPNVGRPSKP